MAEKSTDYQQWIGALSQGKLTPGIVAVLCKTNSLRIKANLSNQLTIAFESMASNGAHFRPLELDPVALARNASVLSVSNLERKASNETREGSIKSVKSSRGVGDFSGMPLPPIPRTPMMHMQKIWKKLKGLTTRMNRQSAN